MNARYIIDTSMATDDFLGHIYDLHENAYICAIYTGFDPEMICRALNAEHDRKAMEADEAATRG